MRWSFRSPAKINPHLRVARRRPDGFHDLQLLFQTVALHDRIDLEPTTDGDFSLAVAMPENAWVASGRGALAAGADNLVTRAYREFRRRWPFAGHFAARLQKAIPWGGGLGGGSSNAASLLLALREITGAPAEVSDLHDVARGLGSDVPFFLLGGFAAGFGRGDELLALEDGPEEEVWIAVPQAAVSTAEVFAGLEIRAAAATLPAALVRWNLDGRRGESLRRLEGANDLQDRVLGLSPEVSAVYAALHRQGVEGVRVTGSGSCLFGFPPLGGALFPAEFPAGQGYVVATRTLSRRALAAFRRIDGRQDSIARGLGEG
jgi:4-diphosphocytidyl-2-C-methyl-D-erythritol kinase